MTKEEELKVVTKNGQRIFEYMYLLKPSTRDIYMAIYPLIPITDLIPGWYHVGVSGDIATLIDDEGNILMDLEGASIVGYHKGYDYIIYQENGALYDGDRKQGVMNLAHDDIVPCEYWMIDFTTKKDELVFSVCKVESEFYSKNDVKNGTPTSRNVWGLLDTKGEELITCKYDHSFTFLDEYNPNYRVCTDGNYNWWGEADFFDSDGEIIWSCPVELCKSFYISIHVCENFENVWSDLIIPSRRGEKTKYYPTDNYRACKNAFTLEYYEEGGMLAQKVYIFDRSEGELRVLEHKFKQSQRYLYRTVRELEKVELAKYLVW